MERCWRSHDGLLHVYVCVDPRRTKDRMTMLRRVEPELLDTLPADDPSAVRSRNDLRRINRLMGTIGMLGDALETAIGSSPSVRIVELGAGDASLMLRLARQRAKRWPRVRVGLLDMQPVVRADTLTGFTNLGWDAQIIGADVFDWLAQADTADPPIIVANLFVHHFDDARLSALLAGIAARARAFVCCEPRRSRVALTGSHLLGAIGCNAVTRNDAVISVRAGFNGNELSRVWPHSVAWDLHEGRAGLFCHRFMALRMPANP